MLSSMKGILGPSTSYQDKLLYMTSLGLHHSIGSDKNAKNTTCVDNILQLVSSSDTRYLGLQLLELALQQNSDGAYTRGRWVIMIYNILKGSHTAVLEKIQACKILSLMIPYMVPNDDSFDAAREEVIKDICPILLQNIKENAEWAEEASICIKLCLKTFPHFMSSYKELILKVILNQVSCNISSKAFEVLADCFCELLYCNKGPENYQTHWREMYCTTLMTIDSLQFTLFSIQNDAEYVRLKSDFPEFQFKDGSDDGEFFQVLVKRVCRFVNLCKCLAKLLSVKSKYSVEVPISATVQCLTSLYTVRRKEKATNNEQAILHTFIPQMRLASLVVIESLILNCNLMKQCEIIMDFIRMAVECSDASISSEPISEFRAAAWKLLSLWLDGYGRKVSKGVAGESYFIGEIMKDINIDESESLQVSSPQNSKKNSSSDSYHKGVLKRANEQKVCKAALNSLESLLCTGAKDIREAVFQEICKNVFRICHIIQSSLHRMPFPYDDEYCREALYSVVQIVVLKSGEHNILRSGINILAHIHKDPSFKVRKLYNKMSVIYRLQLYPNRPLHLDYKQRHLNVSNETDHISDWSSQGFGSNIEIDNMSVEIPENENSKTEQSFQSESEVEVHSEEYMEVETNYPEQVENQCNGEEILEIQNSSQCQDDVESDDEEEEEEEERSYGDEEITQEEPMQEIYIPSSRNETTSPSPVQINSETVQSVTEPEYEELAPCVKIEENDPNTSNNDTCVNGDSNVIHDEEVPSSSMQITNENGVFGMDDDDLDEENVEEEEEENEKTESCDPPAKRQKIEIEDDPEIDERKENPQSPTMEEMKADFVKLLPPIEDVKSGKVQLSTSS